LRSLDELSSTVPNESVVIIYFSGHGYQLRDREEFDQGLIPGGLKKEMVSGKYIIIYIQLSSFVHYMTKELNK